METEMADIEAQNGVANGDIVRNADAAAIFKKANRPVTLKVCAAVIGVEVLINFYFQNHQIILFSDIRFCRFC